MPLEKSRAARRLPCEAGNRGSGGWRGGFQQPTVRDLVPGRCSMTAVVSSAPMATRSLDPRAIGMIEAVVIPVGALVASAVLFSIFLLLLGKSPADFLQPGLDRRLRLGLLHPEHAAARRAADPDRSCLRHSRPHRPDADRRGGRARAGRLLGGRDRHPAGHRRLAGDHRPAAHGDRGDAGRRGSGSGLPAGCGTIAASTRRSPRCCCPTSPSPS